MAQAIAKCPPNEAILICHQIRVIFKLPFRQTEGVINSL
ncbi:transposase [Shewanella sp. VB17]|nr:transposase [Shewanella sp. VB17]